jgi:hypothetical protein
MVRCNRVVKSDARRERPRALHHGRSVAEESVGSAS